MSMNNNRISDDQLRRDAFLILQSLTDYLSLGTRINVTAGFCKLLVRDMKKHAKQKMFARKPIGRETRREKTDERVS